MMNTKHDHKNVEKMRPSATTLVQRYTRNGKSLYRREKSQLNYIHHSINILSNQKKIPIFQKPFGHRTFYKSQNSREPV